MAKYKEFEEKELTGSNFIAKVVLEHYINLYKNEKKVDGEFIDINDLISNKTTQYPSGEKVSFVHHPILCLETR
jgi:hypothetical protein